MRNETEIKEFLLINNRDKTERTLLANAIEVEQKYEKELKEGKYNYAIYSDYVNNPDVLEDESVKELKIIEQIGGIIVYEPIRKEIV